MSKNENDMMRHRYRVTQYLSKTIAVPVMVGYCFGTLSLYIVVALNLGFWWSLLISTIAFVTVRMLVTAWVTWFMLGRTNDTGDGYSTKLLLPYVNGATITEPIERENSE